jgi:hypothetical protein
MIPGDEHLGFDPNAFVQRLIEETGISHVWEPVRTKVAEGGRCFVTMRIPTRDPNRGERVPYTEHDAKHGARQIKPLAIPPKLRNHSGMEKLIELHSSPSSAGCRSLGTWASRKSLRAGH